MAEENRIRKTNLKPDMNSGKTISEREGAHTGTEDYGSTKIHAKKDENEEDKKAGERRRAKLNDHKGTFKTEHTQDTGESSAIPGAEEKDDIGDPASGAGLGGNKGRGTRSRNKQ